MNVLSLAVLLLKHLPQILRLIELLEKAEREAKTERKVKDDLEKINKAFEENDASKLKDIFNS